MKDTNDKKGPREIKLNCHRKHHRAMNIYIYIYNYIFNYIVFNHYFINHYFAYKLSRLENGQNLTNIQIKVLAKEQLTKSTKGTAIAVEPGALLHLSGSVID